MLSKWDIWRYSDESNCWDFVCAFLADVVPSTDLPKFGVTYQDVKGMTRCKDGIIENYVLSEPVQNAIACHYHGKALLHVGVVDGEHVRHVGKYGHRRDTIEKFESLAQRTEYRLHKCLL